MDAHEVLKQLDQLITKHAVIGGSVYQTGYKDDFFTLFREAHDNGWFEPSARPRMTGDAIRDYFFANFISEESEENKKKEEKLLQVLEMWDEWHYALTQYGV
jgi:hypothetical protein